MKLLAVIFFTYWNLLMAFKYEIQFADETLFQPCEEYPNNYLDKFVALPKNITILPDDNVYVEGDLVLLYDFDPFTKYKFQFEFFKRERGEWQKTIYTIRREDFCTSAFTPGELWYTYTKEVPVELRKCPLRKGQTYPLKITTQQHFELTSPSMEGYYRARFEFGERGQDSYGCVDTPFNLFRA